MVDVPTVTVGPGNRSTELAHVGIKCVETISLVAVSALVNAANVVGLVVVLVLVAAGMTAAPRLQVRPLAVVGALAAVAGAFFARVLLLWGGTVGLAAQIEGAP